MSSNINFEGPLPWLINDYQKEIVKAPAGTINVPDLFQMKLQDICKIYWMAKHVSAEFDFNFSGGTWDGSASGTGESSFATPPSQRVGSFGTYFDNPLSVGVAPSTYDLGPQYVPNIIPNPDYDPSDPTSQPTIVGDPPYVPNGQEMIISGLQLILPGADIPRSDEQGWGVAGASARFLTPNQYSFGFSPAYTSYDRVGQQYYVRALCVIADQDNTVGQDEFGGYFERPQQTALNISSAPGGPFSVLMGDYLSIQINGNEVGRSPLYSNGGDHVTGTFILNYDDFF